MVVAALALMPFFRKVTEVPGRVLFPIIFVLCIVGSFAIQNRIFDVYVAMGFGLLGYVLRKCSIPLAPMLIAFILARPLEESIRQTLVGSEGDLSVFFTRPISLFFLILTALSIAFIARRMWKERKGGRPVQEMEVGG
jgi:putative tricarboxylic transport membrane protein